MSYRFMNKTSAVVMLLLTEEMFQLHETVNKVWKVSFVVSRKFTLFLPKKVILISHAFFVPIFNTCRIDR